MKHANKAQHNHYCAHAHAEHLCTEVIETEGIVLKDGHSAAMHLDTRNKCGTCTQKQMTQLYAHVSNSSYHTQALFCLQL